MITRRMRSCNLDRVTCNWFALILFIVAILYTLLSWHPSSSIKTVLNLQNIKVSAHIKEIHENGDGTIDVILRVDQKLKNLEMLRKNVSLGRRVYINKNPNEEIIQDGDNEAKLEPRSVFTKTEYPLTLNTPYVINNKDICSGVKNLTFLIIVHTAPDHFQRRRTLRETWANKNVFKDISLRIVFLFGLASDRKTQLLIENESTVYRDMVQGNFKDTYKNLTHKGVLGFRWISEHCKSAQFIIKADDDVFVNLFHIIDHYLPRYGKKSKQLLCHVRPAGTSPVLHGNTKLKWAVAEDDFRGQKFYPTYCNGYAVFMTPDLIKGMYRSAFLTPFFWVDDVYLFGLLPKKVGAHWENVVKNFTLNQKVCLEAYESDKPTHLVVCTAWAENAMERLWFAALRRMTPSNRALVNEDLLIAVDEWAKQKRVKEVADAMKKAKEASEKAKNEKPANLIVDKKLSDKNTQDKKANEKKIDVQKPIDSKIDVNKSVDTNLNVNKPIYIKIDKKPNL